MKEFDRPQNLSPAKRRLLEIMARERSARAAPRAIERRPPAVRSRLSFGQARLWFLDRWQPNSSLYNECVELHLEGAADRRLLERSLDALVTRHEALRTVFAEENGEPVQVVLPALSIELPLTDLSHRPAEERRVELERIRRSEVERPFDLSKGPLLRARLVKLGEGEHQLFAAVHHIVSDGWSLGIFMRELAAYYRALARGESANLPPLPIQYADYAEWQRQHLDGPVLDAQLEYWKKQLEGAPPVLQLPAVKKRPAVRSGAGATELFEVSSATAGALGALAREEGATLFMALLAAFQTLLHRYSGQADISVGTPVANRRRVETEGLIGFFVNTLVMRTDLSGGPSFRELLRRVREVALAGFAHPDLPFERLVEALKPARDLGHTPLFQAFFALQNSPAAVFELDRLRITPHEVERGTCKFDVLLSMAVEGGRLKGTFEYSTELFDARMARQMVGHFEALLARAVSDPDEPIGTLPMLSDSEREQLVVEWNPTRGSTRDALLHRQFEAAALRTPDVVAAVHEGRSLTYAELNRRANQVAHALREEGVGPDVLVGICVERSLELLVGLFGILKAGGAYVPLDPAYPKERLATLIEDSGARVIVSTEALEEILPESGPAILRLDADRADLESRSTDDPGTEGHDAKQLAYVMYTSGSTGKPKGVMITHENVVRLFTATADWFRFGAGDVWPLFHSFAFDMSVWEIFGALLHGGRLVVVPYLVSRSPEALYDLLVRERVTVLNQTPSAFKQLVAEEERRGGSGEMSLRVVTFGGEALDFASLRPWYRYHSDETPVLVNMYGITETTVHVTYRPITLADVEGSPGSVIGVPIPDLTRYVLDAHRQPVPVGVVGELYVGGPGVARGYLNRPELTAERFIDDPFSGEGKLYKSGDLVRYLASGDMEYIGRADFQVKIRGFRVELEEVEAALARQPGVRACVVLVREDVPGDQRLVAYLVPARDERPTAAALRDALAARLPHYMVPSAIVILEAFPLTTNGKLNRAALPAPAREALVGRDAPRVAPSTELERTIAELWKEVLGLEEVGVGENFFDVGGHSLHIATLHARLSERLGASISMIDLFKYPTVRDLAIHLATDRAAGTDAPDEEEADRPRTAQIARAEGIGRQRRVRQQHRRQLEPEPEREAE